MNENFHILDNIFIECLKKKELQKKNTFGLLLKYLHNKDKSLK